MLENLLSSTVSLRAPQYLKTFLMRLVVILRNVFLIVSKLCQCLEVMHSVVNQYFSTD